MEPVAKLAHEYLQAPDRAVEDLRSIISTFNRPLRDKYCDSTYEERRRGLPGNGVEVEQASLTAIHQSANQFIRAIKLATDAVQPRNIFPGLNLQEVIEWSNNLGLLLMHEFEIGTGTERETFALFTSTRKVDENLLQFSEIMSFRKLCTNVQSNPVGEQDSATGQVQPRDSANETPTAPDGPDELRMILVLGGHEFGPFTDTQFDVLKMMWENRQSAWSESNAFFEFHQKFGWSQSTNSPFGKHQSEIKGVFVAKGFDLPWKRGRRNFSWRGLVKYSSKATPKKKEQASTKTKGSRGKKR